MLTTVTLVQKVTVEVLTTPVTPITTCAPVTNPVPVMVRKTPPARLGWATGLTDVTVGGVAAIVAQGLVQCGSRSTASNGTRETLL